MIVDLITEYPQLWEQIMPDVTNNGWRDCGKMIAYFDNKYGLKVSAHSSVDMIGRMWVDEKDWTLFLLKWNKYES